VMPFVDGESLRARLDREKQLSVSEAVRIATAVAGALDYAHRNSVIHRDLKPENILLQDDQPLIADFGIALAVTKAGGARVTQTGLSLGTPQYMSPEQATGDRGIDARTDIYSLGAVTYEMLAGEPPHAGATAQAIIARLMTEEPRPLTTARRTVPDHVDAAVRCALEKLPADRFQTAKEFADALNGRAVAPTSVSRAARRSPRTRLLTLAAVAVASAALAATAAWLAAQRAQPERNVVRFEVPMPAGQILEDPPGNSIAMSPDGKRLAYIARSGGRNLIHLRDLSDWQSRPLAGTDGPWEPRFSPDGRWILYRHETGGAKKVPVDGGSSITLAQVGFQGAWWRTPGTIYLAVGTKVLALDPNGGPPREVGDFSSINRGAADPFPLPGGKAIVVRPVGAGGTVGAEMATLPVAGGKPRLFDVAFANSIGYLDGWLIFGRPDATIAAVQLSADGQTLGTRFVQLLEGVKYKPNGGVVASLSENGTLAYMEGETGGHIQFIDRRGALARAQTPRRAMSFPQYSPDGRRVALVISNNAGQEIWIYEIATNTLSRLTSGTRPAWTPDGKRIVFVPDEPRRTLSWIPADASGPPEPLGVDSILEAQVTPDGKAVVARRFRAMPTAGGNAPPPNNDIVLVPLTGDRKPIPLLATAASEVNPRVSPDGRWLAYVSNESGTSEVYVRPLMGGARTQISSAGGIQPVWSPDGRRVYYLNPVLVLFSVEVRSSPAALEVTRRDSLFAANFAGSNQSAHQMYDISPDGNRFVGIYSETLVRLRVITNWLDEVRPKLK
jgi:Tol biopolymer transport system component